MTGWAVLLCVFHSSVSKKKEEKLLPAPHCLEARTLPSRTHDLIDPILEPCFLGILPVVWSEDGNLFLGISAAGFKQNFLGVKEYKSIKEELKTH